VDSLLCPVSAGAEKDPFHSAVITSSGIISYAQLEHRIRSAQDYLQTLGGKKGERVALQLANSVDYIAALFALMRIGAVGCLLSTRLPQEAVRPQLATFGCPLFLNDQSWSPPLSAAPHLKDNSVPVNAPALAIFTSGSTGKPKAALLSFGNLYYNALGSNENIPFQPDDRWLLSLPLYHVGGLGILFRAFIAGGTVVIPDLGADLASTIESHQITHLSLVTTQLHRLLAEPARPTRFRSLKAILLGGSTVPTPLITRSLEANLPICTSYGLSEMGSQVTTTQPHDSPGRLSSSGRILKYRQIKISPESEILVRGETRFVGYLTNSGVEEPFDRDGWFATGDLGRVDDDGYLTVLGRGDNLFVSGGENIQPEEIERALCEDPSIEEAIVVPVASAEFGFRPIAFVQMSPHPLHEVPELLEMLRAKLPGFKIPDRILPWPGHLAAVGIKPSRAALRELAQSLVTRS
jgi:o-succinylbenzoate---CoA ligase